MVSLKVVMCGGVEVEVGLAILAKGWKQVREVSEELPQVGDKERKEGDQG